MFSYSQKRKITKTNSTLEEKAWLIDHAEKNDKLSMSRLALDFSSKFNRTINKSTVSRILSSKKQILEMVSADAEIDMKRVKQVVSSKKADFESELAEILRVKFRTGNSFKKIAHH